MTSVLHESTRRGGPLEAAPTHATPVLHVDTAIVARSHRRLEAALPGVDLYYAVKANPSGPVLTTLRRLGCRWDVASPGEIALVLAAGGNAREMSYGNTVKRAADIAWAHRIGVDRFSLDSPAELDRLVRHAPGACLLVRLETSGLGADWALGSKFGCSEVEAAALLAAGAAAGHPVGVCFHVGSQQRDPQAWRAPLEACARLRARLRRDGHDLAVVDLGGGFPAETMERCAPVEEYGAAIGAALVDTLGRDWAPRATRGTGPTVMAEPGRGLVADAGALDTEVVAVSSRAGARWVYLDCGLFGGLAETMGESLRYRIEVTRDGAPLAGPYGGVVLAGPTCDSVDVLYRRHRYELPIDLRAGDRVRLRSTGAYTASYASVGFNGFTPLRETWQ